ncbi:unnamed protein product [Lampetra fluviatilis]
MPPLLTLVTTATAVPGKEAARATHGARHAESLGMAGSRRLSALYTQYLLVTALYMLEPWERAAFSILPLRTSGPPPAPSTARRSHGSFLVPLSLLTDLLLVIIMAMVLYTTFIFMPQHVSAALGYLRSGELEL